MTVTSSRRGKTSICNLTHKGKQHCCRETTIKNYLRNILKSLQCVFKKFLLKHLILNTSFINENYCNRFLQFSPTMFIFKLAFEFNVGISQ